MAVFDSLFTIKAWTDVIHLCDEYIITVSEKIACVGNYTISFYLFIFSVFSLLTYPLYTYFSYNKLNSVEFSRFPW